MRRTNDFESGPKICMNFQRQFYNNHLFVTVSLILILHLMFTSRFFNIGNPKWTPGMKKRKVYIWNRTLISGRVFPSKPLNTFPHALDTSLNLVELCLFYIFHTLGTSISCLCCYCFFSLSNQNVFHPLFLITKKFSCHCSTSKLPRFSISDDHPTSVTKRCRLWHHISLCNSTVKKIVW